SVSANVIDSNQAEGDVKKKSLTIELDLKVSGHNKAMMEKMCGEKFKGGCEINELKALMKDKLDDYEVYDKGEIEANQYDIHTIGVENICDGDEAPDGRAKIVRIEIEDVEEKHNKKGKHTYYKEAIMNVWNIIDKLEYVRKKGEGIEAKNDDFDEAIMKQKGNDHVNDKKKICVSKADKHKATQIINELFWNDFGAQ
ncbi:8570_t:CDS:2, partial [Gigaspora margarita]